MIAGVVGKCSMDGVNESGEYLVDKFKVLFLANAVIPS